MMKKNVFLLSLLFSLPVYVSAVDDFSAPSKYYILIDKSDNTITLYDNIDWVLQWPCTFGSNDMGDKLVQGDRKTPEGSFHIITKTVHKKWHKMMKLDYPTAVDRQKFEERKSKCLIPATAKIGGDIAIHGTWPREDFAVEYLQNWTLGCVSMRNDHLDELYNMVPIGTQVIIQK